MTSFSLYVFDLQYHINMQYIFGPQTKHIKHLITCTRFVTTEIWWVVKFHEEPLWTTTNMQTYFHRQTVTT